MKGVWEMLLKIIPILFVMLVPILDSRAEEPNIILIFIDNFLPVGSWVYLGRLCRCRILLESLQRCTRFIARKVENFLWSLHALLSFDDPLSFQSWRLHYNFGRLLLWWPISFHRNDVCLLRHTIIVDIRIFIAIVVLCNHNMLEVHTLVSFFPLFL